MRVFSPLAGQMLLAVVTALAAAPGCVLDWNMKFDAAEGGADRGTAETDAGDDAAQAEVAGDLDDAGALDAREAADDAAPVQDVHDAAAEAPSCGRPGEPCCDGGCFHRASSVCRDNICRMCSVDEPLCCGRPGWPCCDGGVCRSSALVCYVSPITSCQWCGRADRLCCGRTGDVDRERCAWGTACVRLHTGVDWCRAVDAGVDLREAPSHCGGLGEACCPVAGGSCSDSGWLACDLHGICVSWW